MEKYHALLPCVQLICIVVLVTGAYSAAVQLYRIEYTYVIAELRAIHQQVARPVERIMCLSLTSWRRCPAERGQS